MDYRELIMKRQSYREAFADEPVTEEDLKKILEAGIMAPSGYNLQSTTFVAVTDEKIIKAIAELMPTNATKTAKAMIVPVTKHIESNDMSFEFEDYGASVENMLLAIADPGLCVCMDGRPGEDGRYQTETGRSAQRAGRHDCKSSTSYRKTFKGDSYAREKTFRGKSRIQ